MLVAAIDLIRIVGNLLESSQFAGVIELSQNLNVHFKVIVVVIILNILQSQKLFMVKVIYQVLSKVVWDSQIVVVQNLIAFSRLLFALAPFTRECAGDNVGGCVEIKKLFESGLVWTLGIVAPLWWGVKDVQHLVVQSWSGSPATLFSGVDPELFVRVSDFIELFLRDFDSALIWVDNW